MPQTEKYMEVTKSIRKSNKLLLSFVKQHKPISTEVLFGWCLLTPQQNGVDITLFGSHSTRSVSTLHCQRKYLSITRPQDGLETFTRFYSKPIEGEHFLKVIFDVQILGNIYL